MNMAMRYFYLGQISNFITVIELTSFGIDIAVAGILTKSTREKRG